MVEDRFLKGKVSLVTGAGRGIGRAVAVGLARHGSAVVVNDIDPGSAQDTVDEIRTLGREASKACTDVRDYKAVEQMVNDVVEQYGCLNVLVNNAGVISTGNIEDVDPDEWDRVMQVNLKAVFHTCKACLPFMLSIGSGKIVNLASVAAHRRGGVANTIYAASKAGVVTLTRGLAKEVASRGINVNAISPAVIETDMTKDLLEKLSPEDIAGVIPKGRTGKPQDVVDAVLFLVSERSDFITGEVIVLDGGFSI